MKDNNFKGISKIIKHLKHIDKLKSKYHQDFLNKNVIFLLMMKELKVILILILIDCSV